VVVAVVSTRQDHSRHAQMYVRAQNEFSYDVPYLVKGVKLYSLDLV